MKKTIYIIIIYAVAMLASCQLPPEAGAGTSQNYVDEEQQYREQYQQSRISVTGKVLDENGTAIANAELILDTNVTSTNPAGEFNFSGIKRHNRLLIIRAAGFHTELLPVYLNIPMSGDSLVIPPVLLSRDEAGLARFLFAGDTSFGRRFLDPDELTPRDQVPKDYPDALIKSSDPLPGTLETLKYVRPYYQLADFGVVNFETPVTLDPSTPHWDKDFAYFTLPGSLPALKDMGVDYVSLGNNHVYDYLDPGTRGTIDYLDDAGIPHSGAGLTLEASFEAYRTMVKGSPYAMLSMTSISGRKHSISYVADEVKGGAADLTRDEEVLAAIQRELNAGQIPILQLHGGTEYSFQPSGYIRSAMERVSKQGAALVISHHPHTAQGADIFNGIINVFGLGNFAFDQDRVETLLGLIARVDMMGDKVNRLRFIPVYLEDYRPRPVTGRLVNLLLRRIAEFSGQNLMIYPYNWQGWVEWGETTEQKLIREIAIEVTVPPSGVYMLDLRRWAESHESLSRVIPGRSVSGIRIGRDIMWHGDFEDWDVDEDTLDLARWDVTGESKGTSMSRVFQGTAAAYSTRSFTDSGESVIPFRNRVRVMGDELHAPNKDLSLLGYIKGEDAGPVKMNIRFMASVGDAAFGDEVVYSNNGGTFDWMPVSVDIHMPPDDSHNPTDFEANPRAVRLFLHHGPPTEGSGVVFYDEIAIINWEETVESGELLRTPHARDFLKIEAEPGILILTLELTNYKPRGL